MSPNYFRPANALISRSWRFWRCLETLTLLVVLTTSQLLFAAAQFQGVREETPAGFQRHLDVRATLAPATLGVAYNAEIAVSDGAPPYTFHEHYLPFGLVINRR